MVIKQLLISIIGLRDWKLVISMRNIPLNSASSSHCTSRITLQILCWCLRVIQFLAQRERVLHRFASDSKQIVVVNNNSFFLHVRPRGFYDCFWIVPCLLRAVHVVSRYRVLV